MSDREKRKKRVSYVCVCVSGELGDGKGGVKGEEGSEKQRAPTSKAEYTGRRWGSTHNVPSLLEEQQLFVSQPGRSPSLPLPCLDTDATDYRGKVEGKSGLGVIQGNRPVPGAKHPHR